MGKRNKVTTRDIAEYTGLSQSTVSMILSGKGNVSFAQETETAVKEAARKLGYKKPVKKGSGLEKGLRDTILILAPLLTNSYYTSIIHSITEHAALHNYMVMTQVTFREAEKEEALLSMAKTSQLAGIIILYPIRRIAQANDIFKTTPVVLIGERPDNVRFDCVELDSRRPGSLMGEHLLSLGHRKIAFMTAPMSKHEISRLRRLEGLRLSFEEQGFGKGEDLVKVYHPSSRAYKNYAYQSAEYMTGYEMTKKALAEDCGVTAFVGHNDMTAYGILAALREEGHRIPRDYSVGGFDNATFSSMPQISLTTVDHATIQKGKDAVELIFARNQGKNSPSRITRMEYGPRLVIRKSTGPVPVQ